MLLSAAKLRKMLESFDAYQGKGKVGFRVPSKRLW